MPEPGSNTVSVIIPVRNGVAFIAVAIDSVLAQTWPVSEILVIDGGSDDGTREVAAAYGFPVRVMDQWAGHQGKRPVNAISHARNLGIKAAGADWLAFLDADDWWDTTKLARQIESLSQMPDAALSYTGVCNVDAASGEQRISLAPDPRDLWPALRWRNFISTSTVLVRREAILRSGGFREDLAAMEDWELWVRLRLEYSFACIPEPLTFYRVMPASDSHNIENHLKAIDQMVGHSTMTAGLNPPGRWIFARRFRAAQIYAAHLIAVATGDPRENRFLWSSLVYWPSPLFESRRFISVLRALLGARGFRALRSITKNTVRL